MIDDILLQTPPTVSEFIANLGYLANYYKFILGPTLGFAAAMIFLKREEGRSENFWGAMFAVALLLKVCDDTLGLLAHGNFDFINLSGDAAGLGMVLLALRESYKRKTH